MAFFLLLGHEEVPRWKSPLSKDVLYHPVVQSPLVFTVEMPAEIVRQHVCYSREVHYQDDDLVLDAPDSEFGHLCSQRGGPHSFLFVDIVYYGYNV